MTRGKHRRHGLARALPRFAFRRQQAVAQDRAQHQLADLRHPVIPCVVDQHMAHKARVIDDNSPLVEELGLQPVEPERRLAPQLKRVAHDGTDDLEARRRRCSGNRRRRYERAVCCGRVDVCHSASFETRLGVECGASAASFRAGFDRHVLPQGAGHWVRARPSPYMHAKTHNSMAWRIWFSTAARLYWMLV